MAKIDLTAHQMRETTLTTHPMTAAPLQKINIYKFKSKSFTPTLNNIDDNSDIQSIPYNQYINPSSTLLNSLQNVSIAHEIVGSPTDDYSNQPFCPPHPELNPPWTELIESINDTVTAAFIGSINSSFAHIGKT